jgi:hypothetical protein
MDTKQIDEMFEVLKTFSFTCDDCEKAVSDCNCNCEDCGSPKENCKCNECCNSGCSDCVLNR